MRKQTITEILAIGQRDLLRVFYVCCFWGDRQELDRFLQRYAAEKTMIEARKRGHSVTEQQLADGSVKLTIQVAGGAA
jgi:hypothetical protein